METYPCGHCVVCRRCFIKTIQAAVAHRSLPLRCVICRTKILSLKQQDRPCSAHDSSDQSESLATTSQKRQGTSLRDQMRPVGQQTTAPRQDAGSSTMTSWSTSVKTRMLDPVSDAESTSKKVFCKSPTAMGARPAAVTKIMQPLMIYPSSPTAETGPSLPGKGANTTGKRPAWSMTACDGGESFSFNLPCPIHSRDGLMPASGDTTGISGTVAGNSIGKKRSS